MSEVSPISFMCDLTSVDCKPTNKDVINALKSNDPDQRFAAVKRISVWRKNDVEQITDKLLALFEFEKDHEIISALAELFVKHGIKEVIPFLIEKLNTSSMRSVVISAIIEFADPGTIDVLEEEFRKNPSKLIAMALMRLGDPQLYYDNFANKDLTFFNADAHATRIKYFEHPLWLAFGFDAPQFALSFIQSKEYPNHLPVPTPTGAYNKTRVPCQDPALTKAAEENIFLLLDNFQRVASPDKLSFLLRLFENPYSPFPKEKIVSLMEGLDSQDIAPVMLEELKKSVGVIHIDSLALILAYFKAHYAGLDIALQKEIADTVKQIAQKEVYKPIAFQFLADIDESDFLAEAIKKGLASFYAVAALAKLEKAVEFKKLFNDVLKGTNNCDETAKFYAAYGLLRSGKRDGMNIIFEKLYEIVSSGAKSLIDPVEILELASNMIVPDDLPHIKMFAESSHPLAVLIGLKFLQKLPLNLQAIKLAVAKTKKPLSDKDIELIRKQMELKNGGTIDENKLRIAILEIKLNALLVLVVIRPTDDPATLKIVQSEIAFWKDYLSKKTSTQQSLFPYGLNVTREDPLDSALQNKINGFLPELEKYAENSRIEVETRLQFDNLPAFSSDRDH